MKRQVLAGLALALIQPPTVLAEDYETYLDLSAGTQIDFVVERSRTRIRNGSPEGAALSVTSKYRMSVDPTSSGYRMQIDLVDITTHPEAPPEIMQQLRQGAVPLSGIVVDTTDDLSPVQIRDWERYLEQLGASMAAFIGPSADEKERAGAAAATVSLFRQMGPETATQSLLREWAMTATMQNVALNLNERIEETSEVQILQGMAPITGVYTAELTRLDAAAGIATIVMRDALDPESAATAVRAMIRQLTAGPPEDSRPTGAELDALRLERTTDCTYEMAVASGLASTTRCTMTISAPEEDGSMASQVDRWVITQVLLGADR